MCCVAACTSHFPKTVAADRPSGFRSSPLPAASLPDSIGALQQLRALALRGNRLASLPASLGACSSLAEIDLRDNQLVALPEQLGQLTNLKVLLLDNNR